MQSHSLGLFVFFSFSSFFLCPDRKISGFTASTLKSRYRDSAHLSAEALSQVSKIVFLGEIKSLSICSEGERSIYSTVHAFGVKSWGRAVREPHLRWAVQSFSGVREKQRSFASVPSCQWGGGGGVQTLSCLDQRLVELCFTWHGVDTGRCFVKLIPTLVLWDSIICGDRFPWILTGSPLEACKH